MPTQTITISADVYEREDASVTISLELDGDRLVNMTAEDSDGNHFFGCFFFTNQNQEQQEAMRAMCCCPPPGGIGKPVCRPGPCEPS